MAIDVKGDSASEANRMVPLVTSTSSKIQNGGILVPANPGPPERWPLK